MGIKIIAERCTGCGLCIQYCPFAAIEIIDKKAVVGPACTLCGACIDGCPEEALVLECEPEKPKQQVGVYKNVWIFAEEHNGTVDSTAYELLGAGRTLADKLGVEQVAILLGEKVEDNAAKELVRYGADRVIVVEDPQLKFFRPEVYSSVLKKLVEKYHPEIILGSATSTGRSLLPKLAASLETGLTADCTGLNIDTERHILLQTRPAFGGNIMATIICPDNRPQMATVRPRVMKPLDMDVGRKGDVVREEVTVSEKDIWTRVLEVVGDPTLQVNLQDAEIIVSGGRGLGGPENFKIIRELADALGGAVGSSRAAVDAGWIPYSHQVGQTGKTVCPKIYIACGISGQIQHLVGMQSSDIIIAINRDMYAPIFKVANYGIIGDLFEIVSVLTRRVKEIKGK